MQRAPDSSISIASPPEETDQVARATLYRLANNTLVPFLWLAALASTQLFQQCLSTVTHLSDLQMVPRSHLSSYICAVAVTAWIALSLWRHVFAIAIAIRQHTEPVVIWQLISRQIALWRSIALAVATAAAVFATVLLAY